MRHLQEKGGKSVVDNIDARALGRIAGALENTQAVVEAARKRKRARELIKKAQPATWKMAPHVSAHWYAEIEEDMALERLDAPPEGEG